MTPAAEPGLRDHLAGWLGAWPPELPLDLVGNDARGASEDATERLVGILDPDPPELGEPGLVLSVPPSLVEAIELLGGLDASVLEQPAWRAAVVQALDAPGYHIEVDVLRWVEHDGALGPVDGTGTWVPAVDAGLPPSPRPTDRSGRDEVLLLTDEDGTTVAGLALRTRAARLVELVLISGEAPLEPGAVRGGLATAAQRVLADGDVAIFRHDPADTVLAQEATAAGLPDRGWRVLGLVPPAAT